MNKIQATLIAILMFLSFSALGCGKIEDGYETQDIMYSICPNLAELPNDSISKLIRVLLSQYKGPPDEILIYFVASNELVGKTKLEGDELVGYYYTHSHEIVVFPQLRKT